MEKQNYADWNQLFYYVSHVYNATKKFKAGEPRVLSEKIRRSAVSLSADMNLFREEQSSGAKLCRVYSILSSISVLETYLQLAKHYKLLKDTSVLDEKLDEVKEVLHGVRLSAAIHPTRLSKPQNP